MVTELSISRANLTTLLECEYEMHVTGLTFVPRGETSWGYIVDSDKGKFFFKIYRADVRTDSFEFTRNLHDKCGIQNLIFPQSTSIGKLSTKVLDHEAVLFNFIDGKTERDIGLNELRLMKVGELLGQVHTSAKVIGELTTRQIFDINYKDQFDKVLAFARNSQTLPSEPQQKALTLVKEKTKLLSKLVNELSGIADILNQSSIEFVNCHGDPTRENILITSDEQIYLIDWDEPIFAPKERDLVFFSQKNRFPHVAEGYSKVVGECVLDERIIKFYESSWTVQEVADYGTSLFFKKYDLKQNAHNFEGLEEEIGNL